MIDRKDNTHSLFATSSSHASNVLASVSTPSQSSSLLRTTAKNNDLRSPVASVSASIVRYSQLSNASTIYHQQTDRQSVSRCIVHNKSLVGPRDLKGSVTLRSSEAQHAMVSPASSSSGHVWLAQGPVPQRHVRLAKRRESGADRVRLVRGADVRQNTRDRPHHPATSPAIIAARSSHRTSSDQTAPAFSSSRALGVRVAAPISLTVSTKLLRRARSFSLSLSLSYISAIIARVSRQHASTPAPLTPTHPPLVCTICIVTSSWNSDHAVGRSMGKRNCDRSPSLNDRPTTHGNGSRVDDVIR